MQFPYRSCALFWFHFCSCRGVYSCRFRCGCELFAGFHFDHRDPRAHFRARCPISHARASASFLTARAAPVSPEQRNTFSFGLLRLARECRRASSHAPHRDVATFRFLSELLSVFVIESPTPVFIPTPISLIYFFFDFPYLSFGLFFNSLQFLRDGALL